MKNRTAQKLKSVAKPGQELSQREWENRLGELYAAMRAQPSLDQAMTHAEVEELMPAYLAVGEASERAMSYPLLHQHLQTCSQCSAMYERIKSALEQSTPRQRAATQPADMTKNIQRAKAPVLQIVQTPASGQRLGNIQFLIPPPLMQNRATRAFISRGDAVVQETLLFSAQITLDNHPLLVHAWLASAAKQNQSNIRVELASSASTARRGRAILDWGNNHYENKFSRGQTTFKNITLAELDSPISLTLEFIAHERTRPHPPTRSTTTRATKRAPQPRAKKA